MLTLKRLIPTLLGTALVIIAACELTAEDLPETGTFEGIYHRDRWGVGRFEFFLVEPKLLDRFAPYEGKRLRVVVTKGRQVMNPGPVLLDEVGDISVLPAPELVPQIELVPPSPTPDQPFQFICRLDNKSTRPCYVNTQSVFIAFRRPTPTNEPDKPAFFYESFKNRQLHVRGDSIQMIQQLTKKYPGHYGNLSPANRIVIPAGASFPLVLWFETGLPQGEYELEVKATGSAQEFGQHWPPSMKWLSMSIEARVATDQPSATRLLVRTSEVQPLDDGYALRMTLAPEGDEQRSIAVPGAAGKRSWSGFLRAYTVDGRQIELTTSERLKYDDPWRLEPVADDGHRIELKFRQESYFTGEAIDRLTLGLLTDRGLEWFSLATDFRDTNAVRELPPFGESLQGAKVRVRPTRARFAPGQSLQFHVQAVNESGKPVIWRMASQPGISDNIAIEIDGQAVDLPRRKAEYVFGWAAPWTCGRPVEWTCTLPASVKLAAGKHSLRVSINSSGGNYRNSQNDNVPVLQGTLSSSTIEFEVNDN